jgi:hypothetical protein
MIKNNEGNGCQTTVNENVPLPVSGKNKFFFFLPEKVRSSPLQKIVARIAKSGWVYLLS